MTTSILSEAPLMELNELSLRLGVSGGFINEEEKAKYSTWLAWVSKAIRNYVHWDLSFHAADVQYYDGNGSMNLVLNQPFVWGNSTVAVYIDMTGAYGYGPNAFSAPALEIGTVYAPKIDMQTNLDGTLTPRSKSGLLVKLQNINNSLWWPSDLFYRPAQPGGLAWINGPYWPPGTGNIKVVCDWGFKAMPEDIKGAVVQGVGMVRSMAGRGAMPSSEALGDYNFSNALGQWQEFATVRQLCSAYRDVAI